MILNLTKKMWWLGGKPQNMWNIGRVAFARCPVREYDGEEKVGQKNWFTSDYCICICIDIWTYMNCTVFVSWEQNIAEETWPKKYFVVLYLFICLQVCNLLNVFTIHVFIVRMLIFCMYDCHRQSVNNSLFSLCLYFDFTINYGQHSPMFVFVIVFEGESTEGGARWRRRSKWVKRINLPPLFPPPLGSAIQASKHNYSELERLLSTKRYYKALYWWWMLLFFYLW